jgi:hypothetical protein
MNKVKINQGRTMMPTFRWGLTLILFFAIMVVFRMLPEIPAIIAATGLSFLAPLLWSSYYILEINPSTKKINEYTLIMGKAFFNTETKFDSIEKIFINRNLVGQMMQSYSGRIANVQNVEFQAFIKLEHGDKFFLISDRSIEKLEKRIEPMASKLNTVVVRNF